MKRVIVCAAGALMLALLSACATTDVADNSDRKEEKIYVTGSRVPKKDTSDVITVSPKALETALQGTVSVNAGGR
ncbi:MAG: hypothetical protein HY255_12930 [Betaproteobacteria bacterium]|nr:hypothetical protein [Betaproteobacteria bacterium]